jgi:EamA domain-containing membrane protein RarD
MNLLQFDVTQLYTYFTQMLILVLQAVYVLFAFMLTRQIKLMNHNFQTPLAGLFSFLALMHFLASVGILALSIFSF